MNERAAAHDELDWQRATDAVAIRAGRGPIHAVVTPPGSKSLTNRAFLLAALAAGKSRIRGALDSDDTDAMLSAIATLGATCTWSPADSSWLVVGVDGVIRPGPLTVHARDAGTVARFVAPVLAIGSGEYVLDASDQMRRRPMRTLLTGLRALGVDFESLGLSDALPIRIRAKGLAGGRLKMDGSVSSQFISALLLAGPLMTEGLEILVENVVSRPYIDLTLDSMRAFGARVERDGYSRFQVSPIDRYRAADFVVEPDASAASYFFAAAATTRGQVTVEGLGSKSAQGDVAFAGILERMGASVVVTDQSISIDCRRPLHGIDVDMCDFSDLVPTLAVVAAIASSQSRIRGVGFIRNKESDRIGAVADGLRAMGSMAQEEDDGLSITPGPLHGAPIDSRGDHRIAMSFAVLGLVVEGVHIHGPGSVAKTFPGFFAALDALYSSRP